MVVFVNNYRLDVMKFLVRASDHVREHLFTDSKVMFIINSSQTSQVICISRDSIVVFKTLSPWLSPAVHLSN